MPLFFDLETTGLDPETARILELAVVDGREIGPERAAGAGGPEADAEAGGRRERAAGARAPGEGDPDARAPGTGSPSGGPRSIPNWHGFFHPGMAIPPAASRVHGITDRDVVGAPPFEHRAAELQSLFEGRTLCGYNLRAFDTPLLDAELRRAGQPGLALHEVEEIDLFRVWSALEPVEGRGRRTLERAVARYLDRPLPDAHGAVADALVLPELLAAVREVHGLTRKELLELSTPPDEVDRAGKLRREGNEVVFAFGRHAGEPVARHPDYVEWMLGADFPGETKRILRRLVEGA